MRRHVSSKDWCWFTLWNLGTLFENKIIAKILKENQRQTIILFNFYEHPTQRKPLEKVKIALPHFLLMWKTTKNWMVIICHSAHFSKISNDILTHFYIIQVVSVATSIGKNNFKKMWINFLNTILVKGKDRNLR